MENHRNLRLALRLNAGFSTLSALTIFFAYASLSEVMAVPSWILIAVGIGLAGFAAQLLRTAARQDTAKLRSESLQHSLADFAWVATSGVVIALGLLSETGNWILAAIALPVLALGLAQWRGLPAADLAAATPNA